MTTLATQELLSELNSEKKIRPKTLGYFEGRTTGLFHQVLLKLLRIMEQKEGFSKRKFAMRLGKRPEQITRWFSSPHNLTLGTLSALFLGAGYEIRGIIVTEIATGKTETFPREAPTFITAGDLAGYSGSRPQVTQNYFVAEIRSRAA